jgi:hypothetical protein
MSNEPTIDQKNEAIAVLDGWVLVKGDTTHICLSCDKGTQPSGWCTCDQKVDRFRKNGKIVAHNYFQYHSSWDWLMPVVAKIKVLIREAEYDKRFQMSQRLKPIQNETLNVNLINTHYCVCQFIQWYNQMPEDILTDFEEKKPKWEWHDELTLTAMLIILSPVIIIVAIYTRILKIKQQSNEQHTK